MSCPGVANRDGTCTNCGRPTAVYDGIVQHKRGRWREPLGIPPLRRAVYKPVERRHCPSCNSPMQETRTVRPGTITERPFWRCPWSTDSRFELAGDGSLRCGWPYKGSVAS